MANLESVEASVETKVHQLIICYDGLKAQNVELTQKVSLLEQELSETKQKLADCRKQLQSLTYAKATQVSDSEAKQLHNRLLKLEREVENCISLLND